MLRLKVMNRMLIACMLLVGTATAQTTTDCESPGTVIFDLATIQETMTINTQTTSIGSVGLFLDIAHTFRGDLEIFLTSPEGTTITIMQDDGGTAANVFQCFTDFGCAYDGAGLLDGDSPTSQARGDLSGFAGEEPFGTWTLQITDDELTDEGFLHQWCIKIWEVEPSPESCCPTGVLGDCNGDGVLDISDPITLVEHLTGVLPNPFCFARCDVNADGVFDLSDLVFALDLVF